MAKQLGYTEEEIEALKDGERQGHFAPEVRVALRFAETMTRDAHKVTDQDFAELRRYYSEAQIVELATVIGLTTYFNRFTTALRIDLSGSDAPYDA